MTLVSFDAACVKFLKPYRHQLVIAGGQAGEFLPLRAGDRRVVRHLAEDLLVAGDLVAATTLRLGVPRVRVVVLDCVPCVDQHPGRVAPALLQDVLHHRLKLTVGEAVAVPTLLTSLGIWGKKFPKTNSDRSLPGSPGMNLNLASSQA